MKIFCVIPVYNEEKQIIEVVYDVLPFADEIVLVDDCSDDRTVKILSEAISSGKLPSAKVKLLFHIINRGQGAALKTGTEYAIGRKADIIVHFDADGQFLAEEIREVIAPIVGAEADIVFGSRFLEKKSQLPFLKKYLIMPIGRLVNRVLLGVKLTDPQSGFRAFSGKASMIIDWQQDRMSHCSEILFSSAKSGLKIKEVPITVIYHDFGQKFSGGIKILKELLIGSLLK